MENKITELLLSTDKALKELYINFVHYKDAKKIFDLQEKNKNRAEFIDYENLKQIYNNLQSSHDADLKKIALVRAKLKKIKCSLQELTNKDKSI